uniref:Uncharacterized protein n=1 Tax=Caenorhabditis japonica TaxID=281687 RepID=A0A8R1IYJ8_CAEJA
MEENVEKIDKSIDERVHQQLVYKDNRIIDLNNVILDKERQILDLQERVREHNEVNTVKNQAMRIVQQKFEEMNRDKKDMSTETDQNLLNVNAPSTSTRGTERRTRSSSPGHVIAARKSLPTSSSGTFSPPPIDPPFESTSKLGPNLPDIDGISKKHHQRKRVTFDLNPGAPRHPHHPDALESALTEASSENALLRQQVVDLNAAVEKMKSDYESEIVKYTKEAKTAGLKAKVAATARIKELESQLGDVNGKFVDESERLKEEVSTLRSSRNWEIEQNGQLREQVAHLKEKSHKLTEELDASEKAKRELDNEVEESKKLIELMVDDLLQAENAINYHVNQKEAIFEDVDRLKEAIVAQDRFIEILEADIVIYEQHIGLLRESLGASKIDHRALIKSKAFETKLLALEREKEQLKAKNEQKSNEDRLKTKALDKKCRVLVEQNEQLMARLCELQMSSSGSATADETKDRHMAEQEERIRHVSAALEAERDISQRLRESKDTLERELLAKTRHEEATSNRMRRDVEMSQMDAQNKIDEMTVEVEAAHKKVADVMAEVEQLRATNFDLQMHIETAKRTMEELATSNEELEERVREVEESFDDKEDDLKQSTWDVEMLTKQNEALRVELDGIRQGFHDTRELSEEVKLLKSELVRQQEQHRAQFEAACERLEQEDLVERKTSLEVQQEQYILAFEQKIKEMSDQLKDVVDEKHRMRRLLDEKERELLQMADNVTPVQRKTTSVLEAPNLEAIQMSSVPVDFEALNAELQGLQRQNEMLAEQLKRTEMEASLSGELNVELGRAMLELEEQNELLRREQDAATAEESASGRELEMHVLMVQEMTEQISTMQARINEMELAKSERDDEVEQLRNEVETAQQDHVGAKSEIARLLHNLAEFEIARKEDLEKVNSAHDAEIREFSIKMEDSRREISDLEVKLQESQFQLASKEQINEPIVQETQILSSSTPLSDIVETPATGDDEIREQNRILKECHQDVSRDMSKLIELKDELEIAVQALKAEIWSLNGQLKASILDRESLEDKVAEIDTLLEKEKKRAVALDVELQEQVDLTDRAVRRAAEAENESNQRMAECLEKETSREEIEKAYTRLNEYYNQLQEAYNNVYVQLAAAQTPSEQATSSETLVASSDSLTSEVATIIDGIMTVLLIARDPSISFSTQQKLEKVAEKLKCLVSEYDENQKALEEQRQISHALEQRLQTLETNSGSEEVTTTRQRVEQLEGEIEWKEEECEGLKRRIRELEKALEAVAERADEEEAEHSCVPARRSSGTANRRPLAASSVGRLKWRVPSRGDSQRPLQSQPPIATGHRIVPQLPTDDNEDEGWGWGEESKTAETHSETPELAEAKSEVTRLSQIEKTLNNRILALEDQNLELEERLQELEDELMTRKQELTESKSEQKPRESAGWDDWEEPQPSSENSELVIAQTEISRLQNVEQQLMDELKKSRSETTVPELQNTITELQQKLKFQKEVIEKAEAELIEQQDRYDELDDAYNQAKEAAQQNSHLLESLKSQLDAVQTERDALKSELAEKEAEKQRLEEVVRELEEAQREKEKAEENAWNDDGWGDDEPKKDDVELLQLRQVQIDLSQRIENLELEKLSQRSEHEKTLEQLTLAENTKTLLVENLEKTQKELENVKHLLVQKEQELVAATSSTEPTSSGWDDDAWNDDSELDKMKESQMLLEMKVKVLTEELHRVKENEQELIETNSEFERRLKATESELKTTKLKLSEAESSAWNDEEDETKKALEAEVQRKTETVERLLEQIAQLQTEVIEASESADMSALEELESVKGELRVVLEQNGLLKDSEARLLDHADDFAGKMEEYREKCAVLTARVTELEAQVRKSGEEEKLAKKSSDELVTLRQKLANAEQDVRSHNATISDREGLIAELRGQVAEHQKTIEELKLKLKSISAASRRVARPSTSSTVTSVAQNASRPSSRMSTSSRISTSSSSFVPTEGISVPLQSAGSAFDVVIPQSGEPLRRRNK